MNMNEFEGAADVALTKRTKSSAKPKVKTATAKSDVVAVSAEAKVAASVDAVASAMEKVGPATPSRSTNLKATAYGEAIAMSVDYSALGLSDEAIEAVEQLRLEFGELGRRSTDHVFECGRVMDAVHRIAPDQKSFGKLVKDAFGMSRTGAENLARVHRNLMGYRQRLVRIGLPASSLYVLATAEPDKVEEIVASVESGERPSVKAIKALLATDDTKPGITADDGGPAGLKARIAEKTSVGVEEVMNDAEALFTKVLILIEEHRQGKRLVVKVIRPSLIHPTRLLRERLKWLTYLAVPAPEGFGEGAIHHHPPSESQKWRGLLAMLEDLGGYESWPSANDVGSWLAETVAPQLEWLLGERAKRSHAVIQKMTAAVEAEQAKAEALKQRAKSDAKKAREKARAHGKRDRAKADRHAKRETKTVEPASRMNTVFEDITGANA